MVIEQAKKNISRIYAEDHGIMPQDIHFIVLKISGIKIDGYEVEKISGFSGETIEFKFVATFLPKHYLEIFERIFNQLGLKILRITHEIELLPDIISNTASDGIFIDLGGDITQIFLVRKGELEKFEEVNVGGRIFRE